MGKTYFCKNCNKEFEHKKNTDAFFCSKQCYFNYVSKDGEGGGVNHYLYNKIQVNCNTCGKELFVPPHRLKQSNNIFCDRLCLGKYNSKRNTGKTLININCEYCDNIFTMELGIYNAYKKRNSKYFCCKEHNLKWRSENLKGINSKVYKGSTPLLRAIRVLPEYYIWRNKCFERDSYTCVSCGNKENLIVHHIFYINDIINKYNIKNVNEMRVNEIFNDIKNGITLCKDCHKETHKNNGYKSSTKQKYQ